MDHIGRTDPTFTTAAKRLHDETLIPTLHGFSYVILERRRVGKVKLLPTYIEEVLKVSELRWYLHIVTCCDFYSPTWTESEDYGSSCSLDRGLYDQRLYQPALLCRVS